MVNRAVGIFIQIQSIPTLFAPRENGISQREVAQSKARELRFRP